MLQSKFLFSHTFHLYVYALSVRRLLQPGFQQKLVENIWQVSKSSCSLCLFLWADLVILYLGLCFSDILLQYLSISSILIVFTCITLDDFILFFSCFIWFFTIFQFSLYCDKFTIPVFCFRLLFDAYFLSIWFDGLICFLWLKS